MPHKHPVNRAHHDDAPLGARVADRVTGFMGSWKFVIIQSIVVVVWVSGNVWLIFHFDPFPFILLNLAFSTQAAYAAPLILLAGNRQALKDRLTLEHAAQEADKADAQNIEILTHIKVLQEHVVVIQKRILDIEREILKEVTDEER